MKEIRLACHAMATRFELVLAGGAEPGLRAAGEEALATIHRLDARLSGYRATSEVGRINTLAAHQPVRVDGEVFRLLKRAAELSALTGGAFDVTVGPLLRCWGLTSGGGRVPAETELAEARARVGMHLLELDDRRFTVRFARPGMAIDLGAIGKGYALEQATHGLREVGVAHALLHGGTSSIQAIGGAPDGGPWRIALEYPEPDRPPEERRLLAMVELRDRALSVSAASGKGFQRDDAWYGHVLDPRLGGPAAGALLAAVVCDSGTDADALSTAMLVLAERAPPLPAAGTLVVGREDATGSYRVTARDFPARVEPFPEPPGTAAPPSDPRG